MFLKVKEFFLFLAVFFLFFIIIFLFKNFIFVSEDYLKKEEQFIFENNENIDNKEKEKRVSEILIELKRIEKESRKEKIFYSYYPNLIDFGEKIKDYKYFFDVFFLSETINSQIKSLEISFYNENSEVRGKMKNRKIHIFGLYEMDLKEALAVGIHEFGHFYDIYILKKGVFEDLSDEFYRISWDERNILKKGGKIQDFVSGYAMTNVYEDFAESFNYYILHNKDFEIKAKKSEKLQQKYNFFKENIFRKNEFITDEFYVAKKEKNIWDTTKQDFDLEKFKKYLEKIEEN